MARKAAGLIFHPYEINLVPNEFGGFRVAVSEEAIMLFDDGSMIVERYDPNTKRTAWEPYEGLPPISRHWLNALSEEELKSLGAPEAK